MLEVQGGIGKVLGGTSSRQTRARVRLADELRSRWFTFESFAISRTWLHECRAGLACESELRPTLDVVSNRTPLHSEHSGRVVPLVTKLYT